jgi:hypothetical protein
MKYLLVIILLLILAMHCFAGELPAPPPLPEESAVEQDYFQKIWNNWNKLEVLEGANATTNPDGLKKGIKGEIVLFTNTNTSKSYLEVNTDGNVTWLGVELTNIP